MSCNDYAWKIGPYIDGELPTAEGIGVETHLEHCDACRRMAMRFRALDRLAGDVAVPPVPGREWTRMLESITARPPAVDRETRRRSWEWLVPLTSVAALVLLSFFVGQWFFQSPAGAPGGSSLTQNPTSSDEPGTMAQGNPANPDELPREEPPETPESDDDEM